LELELEISQLLLIRLRSKMLMLIRIGLRCIKYIGFDAKINLPRKITTY